MGARDVNIGTRQACVMCNALSTFYLTLRFSLKTQPTQLLMLTATISILAVVIVYRKLFLYISDYYKLEDLIYNFVLLQQLPIFNKFLVRHSVLIRSSQPVVWSVEWVGCWPTVTPVIPSSPPTLASWPRVRLSGSPQSLTTSLCTDCVCSLWSGQMLPCLATFTHINHILLLTKQHLQPEPSGGVLDKLPNEGGEDGH